MIITFCGHSFFQGTEEFEKQILNFLQEKVGDEFAEFYLGGYGYFDNFAYSCCKKYKNEHKNVSLVFVTPYISPTYLENKKGLYDTILYPEIEKKPPKFAITYRNKFMIEKADYVIAYVGRKHGGAYTAYKYAKKLGKYVYNLTSFK